MSDLGEFEGRPVRAIKVIITKAGDGLSKAMAVEPTILHQEDEGYLVLSYRVTKIRFDPVTDEDGNVDEVDRVQILEAQGATLIDDELGQDMIQGMQARIAEHDAEVKRLKDEAKGIFTFPEEEES